MIFEDFSWHPVSSAADLGDLLQCGEEIYASVVVDHEQWLATVNLHCQLTQQRSGKFDSKGEAQAAVHEWLRNALRTTRIR